MKFKRIIAGLTSAMLLASMAGCGGKTSTGGNTTSAKVSEGEVTETAAKSEEPIQLTVYSQLANYSGKLTGWFATVMKQKFNVEMTIIPDPDGTFDTRMESGNLGDIVIFGSNGDQYQRAVKEGMLFDWNEDDIFADYGSYIKDNMTYAVENNMDLNESFTGERKTYGVGHNVATSAADHEAFFYTWDLRWDLYKQLNYPKVSNLDDLFDLFVEMRKISPTDDNGNKTYAASLWPDWDGNMTMYVKSFATAYWGYDEMGFGHYDVENGDFLYALEEDSPYLKSLKFFNKLYQADLIDPNSMTQTFDTMTEKVLASGTFFSIFNFSGSLAYNTEEIKQNGKIMCTLTPDEATPIAYGMNVKGGNRIWTIGAKTEYPELCMEIINWLATPEGYMTYLWGPKDACWYYDENGNSCLTELGETMKADRRNALMPEEWGGGTFNDGCFAANNTTWSMDATNPDSNGETYNADNWISRRTGATCDIQQDWMDYTGCYDANEYLNGKKYKLSLATSYSESSRSDDLKIVWEQVAKCIVNYSWQAMYAADDAAYDKIVAEMIQKCKEYDPDGLCLEWCENEAKIRCALEDDVR